MLKPGGEHCEEPRHSNILVTCLVFDFIDDTKSAFAESLLYSDSFVVNRNSLWKIGLLHSISRFSLWYLASAASSVQSTPALRTPRY